MTAIGFALRKAENVVRTSLLRGVLRQHEAVIRMTAHGHDTFLDLADCPWVREIENRYPAVVREMNVVLERLDVLPRVQDSSPEQRGLTDDHPWKGLIFCGYGASTTLGPYFRRQRRRFLESEG